MVDQRLSWWWLPPPAEAAAYAEAMETLRSRLGGPAFPAHVTVGAPLHGDPAELQRRAEALLVGLPRPRFAPVAVAHAPERHRCLVVELAANAAAHEAHRRLSALSGHEAPWRPHLSLVYGRLPEEVRAATAEALDAQAFPPFEAEGLALWDTTPLRSWREVGRIQLG